MDLNALHHANRVVYKDVLVIIMQSLMCNMSITIKRTNCRHENKLQAWGQITGDNWQWSSVKL